MSASRDSHTIELSFILSFFLFLISLGFTLFTLLGS